MDQNNYLQIPSSLLLRSVVPLPSPPNLLQFGTSQMTSSSTHLLTQASLGSTYDNEQPVAGSSFRSSAASQNSQRQERHQVMPPQL